MSSSAWPTPDELHARLEEVLTLAVDTVSSFGSGSIEWRADLDGFLILSDKVLIEAALLVLISGRTPDLSEQADDLLIRLEVLIHEYLQSPRITSLLIRYPQCAPSFAIGLAALRRSGLSTDPLEALVVEAFVDGSADSVERLPYRAMDVRWVRGILNPSLEMTSNDLLSHSILMRPIKPAYMTNADAYALTHAIMYLSDFGKQPLPSTLDIARLSNVIDASIAWHIASGNLDLLAEFLIAASMLGNQWTSYASMGWSVLFNTWDRLGFLPSPTFDRDQFEALPGDERRDYGFRHIYHTMFVAGILCSVLLQHPRTTVAGSTPPTPRRTLEVTQLCHQALDKRALRDRTSSATESAVTVSTVEPLEPMYEVPSSSDVTEWIRRLLTNLANLRPDAKPLWATDLTFFPPANEVQVAVLADGLLTMAIKRFDINTLAAAIATVSIADLPISCSFVDTVEFAVRLQHNSRELGIGDDDSTTARSMPTYGSAPATPSALWLALSLAGSRLDGALG